MNTAPAPQSENELLLDHSYDGIQEFDNPLPGWWVRIFWATIILSPAYVVYFHFGIGDSITDQYEARAASYFQKQAELYAGVEVTEEVLADFMNQPALMAGMRKKFEGKCATCHGMSAQGLACPNLTDDYFLHGGDLLSIFKTIRDGVPGKEMKSWKDELTLGGVMTMSAYIGSLRGTRAPGGKDPQGELYSPGK